MGNAQVMKSEATLNKPAEVKTQSFWRVVVGRFLEHRLALASLCVIMAFVAVALGADWIASWMGLNPTDQDILSRFAPPSAEHPLGLDEAGRDVLMRLIYGTRISLLVAFVSAFAAMVIGIAIGSLAGYYGGWMDTVLMRFTDSLLALPLMPVLIILAAIDFGKIPMVGEWFASGNSSVAKMIIIFVIFSWMTQARLVRSAILSIREQEFVQSAKTIGMSDWRIITTEILPNVLSPVIVSVTLGVGQAILFESALSFLGLGIQPPTPSWGNMLTNALEMIYTAPNLVIIPGFLILVVVMSFNFLGDGLQDAMDPKAIRR